MSHRSWVESPQGSTCATANDLRNCFVQRRRVDCSCSTGNVNFGKCTAKDLVPSNNFPTTTHAPHSHTTTLSNISYRQGHLRQPRFRGKAFHGFDQGPRARRSHVLQACNCCSLPPHSGCEPMSLPRAGAVSTQHRAHGCHLSGLACKCNATVRTKAPKIFPWRRVVLVRNLGLASVVWVWANISYNSLYCVVSRLQGIGTCFLFFSILHLLLLGRHRPAVTPDE